MFWEIANFFYQVDFLSASLRLAITLLIAALGGIFSERSGVLNFALEGKMLMGAFMGVMGAMWTNNVWIGILFAMVGGGALGLVHAFMSVTLKTDQIVSGVAINFFSLGFTTFMARLVFPLAAVRREVPSLSIVKIPLLSDIPYLGPILFTHQPYVYLGLLLVPLSTFILFKTTWGLQIQAVGEFPAAADNRGIAVNKVRYICVLIAGVLSGIGGASLSLGQINTFVDNMTGGRGFIAFGAMIFGRWHPVKTLLAALLFGAGDALQLRIQTFGLGIPSPVVLMIPYVLTLLALAGFVGSSRPPAALGTPYRKEE